jgi:MoCo/4Fe-4S cofactor protein with predicted Tat translocation signal
MKPLPLPPTIELHQGGPRFWRSLEEWSRSPEFLPYLHREFPEHASEWAEGDEGVSRRRFLQLMGASFALAGLSACTRQAQEKIVPYVKRPEEIIPGRPIYYATTFPHRGYGKGVIVRTEMARPTHIEGNPDHPASLGATDVFMQASVLGLYDPDRSQLVRHGKDIATRDDFAQFARSRTASHDQDQGAGLFLLTGRITSPSLSDQIERMHQRFPKMSWCAYEPSEPNWSANRDKPANPQWSLDRNDLSGPNFDRARGQWEQPVATYDLAKADVIVSLGADFLGSGPANLIHTKAFSARRRDPAGNFNRLYVVESVPTITGAKADVRWPRKPSEIVSFARELGEALVQDNPASDPSFPPEVRQLAAELKAHHGRAVVLAGDDQPQLVHDWVAWLNVELSDGKGPATLQNAFESQVLRLGLNDFVQALQSGAAQTLLIAGVNPSYDLAPEWKFTETLARIPHSVHLGLHDDETGSLCAWHLPESHYLESWGDILAIDGTPSLIQPMIEPLYPDTMSLPEVVSLFIDSPARAGYDIMHDFWEQRLGDVFGHPLLSTEPKGWECSLNKGVISVPWFTRSPLPVTEVPLPIGGDNPPTPQNGELELIIHADSAVDDGRYANNSWLQELPRPLSKLTWDNVAMVSPKTAQNFGLAIGDVVELTANGRSVEAPIWIQPGHADDCVSVTLGYGRSNVGAVANSVGFNAYTLRAADPGRTLVTLATLKPTGRTHPLASTQHHFSMEGRDLVHVQTLADYKIDPHRTVENDPPPDPKDDLYPPFPYKDYAWAMSIDLSSCVGCNACIVACQSENNIPVVGKDQVIRGREMHWIRVDRYFEGAPEDPAMHFQPVVCMQCEQAPCEVVCPVGATVHSSEGLNDMVYNRCVGTRYCSNNCPYKVRRFNFLKYDDETHPTLALQKNPDVTIRTRGVMEKCTYCVQRIESARIDAQKEMRNIRDGEIVTACQAACPADAIVFGNRNDPQSRVAKLQAQPRNYALLAELNTRPRTTYLAKITNPPAT